MKKSAFIAHSSWFMVVFLIISMLGCASLGKKQSKAGDSTALLQPQSVLRFGDIPIPAGFKIMHKESYSFENTGVRVAVLKYRGKASADNVINFYKEQMPMYNWDLLNTIEYGERLMNFDRENETCLVSIMPKWNGSILTISLGPKSVVNKKSAKPVK